MTDHDVDKFEMQLRRMSPAKPPGDFTARLLAAKPAAEIVEPSQTHLTLSEYFRMFLRSPRWVIATAVVVGLMIWQSDYLFRVQVKNGNSLSTISTASAQPALMANDVKINHQLLSSFGAVAHLPSGEPVRFRCENWVDQVVLNDKTQGLMIENRTPRFEVIPVGYETY